MSTDTAPAEQAEVPDEHHGIKHPTDKQYVMIGVILGVLTLIEVALYYIDIGTANNASLIGLAIAKFAIVALFFMHLRFDRPVLRRLFATGLALAVAVYLIYLMTLGAYIPGG